MLVSFPSWGWDKNAEYPHLTSMIHLHALPTHISQVLLMNLRVWRGRTKSERSWERHWELDVTTSLLFVAKGTFSAVVNICSNMLLHSDRSHFSSSVWYISFIAFILPLVSQLNSSEKYRGKYAFPLSTVIHGLKHCTISTIIISTTKPIIMI